MLFVSDDMPVVSIEFRIKSLSFTYTRLPAKSQPQPNNITMIGIAFLEFFYFVMLFRVLVNKILHLLNHLKAPVAIVCKRNLSIIILSMIYSISSMHLFSFILKMIVPMRIISPEPANAAVQESV